MAKAEKKAFDYSGELKRLREEGPQRLYLFRGEEDFLRDSFLKELRAQCLEEGTEAFNYHRIQGAVLDMPQLLESVEAMPFMGERTLTEVRDFDINKTSAYDPEALKNLVADLPEWATVVFVFAPGYAPDNRLAAVKAIKKYGRDIEFTSPREAELTRWVIRRVEGLGKKIDAGTANYLIWICGSRMNTLIPEILKITGVAAGEEITRRDIDAVAKKAPETTIFDLTDALGGKNYEKAASLLADLLADRDEPPQKQIAMVSEQYRRLYVTRVAMDSRRGDEYISECIPEIGNRSFIISNLKRAARNYSRERLARAVNLCVQCDFEMKSNGPEPAELMKELILKLAMDKAI